jgi:hypothetical protein
MVDIELGCAGNNGVDLEQPDRAMVGGGRLFCKVLAALHLHLHIALTTAEPDLTDQDIL